MKKTVLVTGGTSGLGKATALALAKKGYAISITARNAEKGEKAVTELKAESGSSEIRYFVMELSDFASVRRAASDIAANIGRLDVLVNNAGISTYVREESNEGHEMDLQVNYLSPYLLTGLLLPMLRNTGRETGDSRIVTVASGVHSQAAVDTEDLELKKNWAQMRAYANTKLYDIHFTRWLAEKLTGTGISAYTLSPGLVKSDFFRYGKMPFMLKVVMAFIGRPPEKGAETAIWLASEPQPPEANGKYFTDCKPGKLSAAASNGSLMEKLIQFASSATGFTY